jgi:uncharacterized protein with HEPN domain
MSSDQEIILDLYHALNQILTFTQNMDKQEFINDEKTQSSVLYQLVIRERLKSQKTTISSVVA